MKDEELVELLGLLVEKESITGNEKNIVDTLSDIFTSLGLESIRMPSGSIAGVLNGKEEGPTVLIDGHVDTVPIPDINKWTYDPFKLTRSSGLLYGRGTSDMKGGVAAAIGAVSEIKNLKKGRVVISCTVEEERFEGLTSREMSSFFKPDKVIIAESTHCRINIGQRGRCEVVVTAKGRSCHSSNPEMGHNAVLEAVKAIEEIGRIEVKRDPLLGGDIMVLTDIISSPYPGMSIVPEKCRITYDRRTLPGETMESVIEPINDILKEKGIDAFASVAFGDTTTYTGKRLSSYRFFPSWKMDENDAFVTLSREALEKEGIYHGLGHYAFCTNGSHYMGEALIPTIGYGPGEEKCAHIVDEYISEEDLFTAKRGLKAILEALLS